MKNILIVGSNGMLGHDLVKVFEKKGYNVFKAIRQDFDITIEKDVENFFEGKSFDLVINSVAYTQVDKAEEEKEMAFLVNEEGARNLARSTNKRGIPIVYISTDYVFDGKRFEPNKVSDKVSPVNVYGESKLAGEIATKEANPKHYIARTSWLYGENGNNFVDTMLELAKTRSEIKVVNDQFSCPTWTVDLACGIEKLFRDASKFGVYHLCGSGQTSWYEFAKEIFRIKKLDIKVLPVTTDEFPRPATRPSMSTMDNSGLLRDWKEALRGYTG